jgi:HSP20 family protein
LAPLAGDLLMSPFGMMRRMTDEMNRLFSSGMSTLAPAGMGFNFPTVDVRETAGSYVVDAELPGMQASDVDVSIQNDTLILRGESTRHQESQDEGYHLTERQFGSFYREIPLPGPVDSERCSADFHDGVLKVRLPKTGQSQGKKINVNHKNTSADNREQKKSGLGGTVPGTAEHASQPGVEASTADQSYAGVSGGKGQMSAEEAAKSFQGDQNNQEQKK